LLRAPQAFNRSNSGLTKVANVLSDSGYTDGGLRRFWQAPPEEVGVCGAQQKIKPHCLMSDMAQTPFALSLSKGFFQRTPWLRQTQPERW
jgi:hypothetical protein